jgi:hypothetical protein
MLDVILTSKIQVFEHYMKIKSIYCIIKKYMKNKLIIIIIQQYYNNALMSCIVVFYELGLSRNSEMSIAGS